jgi:hypothetical protein
MAVQAVESLAHIETDEAEKAVLELCGEHPEKAIQKAAINAYMWNAEDSQSAATKLESVIDQDMHRYIDRPRFTPNVAEKDFNLKLASWLKRWGEGPDRYRRRRQDRDTEATDG